MCVLTHMYCTSTVPYSGHEEIDEMKKKIEMKQFGTSGRVGIKSNVILKKKEKGARATKTKISAIAVVLHYTYYTVCSIRYLRGYRPVSVSVATG